MTSNTNQAGKDTDAYTKQYNDTYSVLHTTLAAGTAVDSYVYTNITSTSTTTDGVTTKTDTYMSGTVADSTKWTQSKMVVTTTDSDGMITSMVTTNYAGDAEKTVVSTVTYTMKMNDDGSMTEETDTYSPALKANILTNTTTTKSDNSVHTVVITKSNGVDVDSTATTDYVDTDDGLRTMTSTTVTGKGVMSSQSIMLAYQAAIYNIAVSAFAGFALLFVTLF